MTSPTSVSFDVIARDRASQPLDQVGNRARRTGEDLERIGTHAQKGSSKLGGLFASLGGGLAAGAAAAGVTAAAALMTGFVNALDMERASDKLDAQLGATAEESARWGEVAGSLYADAYGESFGAITNAIGLVVRDVDGMRAATEADLERISRKATDVARVFDQDMGGVTRAVGQLMRTGLAKDADEALDIVAAAFRSGIDAGGDLLDTINEYSIQFRDVGLSGSKALGMVSQAMRAGARDADVAADAIKEFAIRSKDAGSPAVTKAYKDLGLSAKEMLRTFAEGGPEADAAMATVIDRIKAMKNPVEQNAAVVALFGTKAEDLQDALFAIDPATAVDALGEVEGAAADLAAASDNTATKIEAARNRINLALADMAAKAIAAFDDMTPAEQERWREIAADVRAVGDAFAEFIASEHGQATLQQLAATLVALGKIAVAAANMGSALDQGARVPLAGLRLLTVASLETFGVIVNGASKALFPFGGPLADKLDQAAKEFNRFKHRANNALLGINDRTVNVDVRLRGISNVQEQMNVRLGRRAMGGPVKAGSAYIVGEERAEVFVPDRDGQIIPSISEYQRAGGMSAGMTAGQVVPQVWQVPASTGGLDRLFLSWLQGLLRDNPGVVLRTTS